MERKIDLRALNIFLLLALVGTFVIVLVLDFGSFIAENPGVAPVAWRVDRNIVNWTDDGPAKVTAAIISCVASVVFFVMGNKYNVIRKHKQEKQLATQIYLSLVYLGIARLFEAYFIVSDSDLRGMVYSVGKYYIVLDLLGVILFVLVSSEVFLQMDFPETSRFPDFLRIIVVASVFIALSALFLEYAPAGIEDLLDWCVIGASIVVFLIIGVILIAICVKIIRLYNRLSGQENRGAILVIGAQLLLFIVSMFILIYLEMGPGDALDYYLRAARCGLMLVIASLYMLAFIKPAMKKGKEIDSRSP
ncbi:MAG: hypothetical protein Q6373_019210 [Candidatus Sigynarchaeota archaeon]